MVSAGRIDDRRVLGLNVSAENGQIAVQRSGGPEPGMRNETGQDGTVVAVKHVRVILFVRQRFSWALMNLGG